MHQQSLYDFANEHDACGVGLVANINNVPSHAIIEHGLTILKRLMHRGATGSDPNTGDGAGILTALPDGFFRKRIADLPPKGKYAVAMIFGGENEEKAIERVIEEEGGRILAWRVVPCHAEAIGPTARDAMPLIRQLFIDGAAFDDADAFARRLFVMRRRIEKGTTRTYVCSLSARSIVYKGLLLAPQVEAFYPDLLDGDFISPLALVHQRYSTNTFPTWNLAQPFRLLAHNGEINTLRGNRNSLKAREALLRNDLFGADLQKVLPLLDEAQSDSASLDNMYELLTLCGRDLCHAMLMLVPQAWGEKYHMGHDIRAFFEYHSALMEPWDGPAALAFSDGRNAGAMLDRNGLRPARYTICKDGLFVLASETGVLDIPADWILRKGRLKPGSMIYLDLEHHRLLNDTEIKTLYARRRPYRRWIEENRIPVQGLFTEIVPSEVNPNLLAEQRRFGYTDEDIELILKPMAETGREPVGSMGNDAALAVLSNRKHSLFDYFHQLFAQVTNPPIDPIREELVMSLTTHIGNLGNILEETPQHARLIKLRRPVLTDDELRRISNVADRGFPTAVLPMAFPAHGDGRALEEAVQTLADHAVAKAKAGAKIIVLSDRNLSAGQAPLPSLLATAAVNRRLVDEGLRVSVGLILQTGEVREVMHYCLLLGYGATAVNPYLALETVAALNPEVAVKASSNYVHAVSKGLLKTMSKMGISTLRSYRSAQIFEIVGLGAELSERYFAGTASRVGGIGFDALAREYDRTESLPDGLLATGGQYRYRKDAEEHLWTPQTVRDFRLAVRSGDYDRFKAYSAAIDDQTRRSCTLRGLLRFKKGTSVPLDEVEPVEKIVRHFVGGAMSLGSLSPEAHETIARAFNALGSMSNCGEGGENAERFDGETNCGVKQVASGRFGVTIDYLRHAKDLQIKLAQGAKPGEGGQLPAHKVNDFVARLRHARPGTTLISPPPHHDIYSIEDLAQLIFDLRCANPQARISVKLVSEVGVGTIAAGVAKAHADVVLISGFDGGTGAAPLSSMKHAGLPWELGLSEAQQTLMKNDLRGRVKIQVDGQLKTGRDIVIAALLGAEEFGFGTTLLVSLGCVQDRRCHCNTCPVGIATQEPRLRACFAGKTEHVVNFLRFLAEEVREHLAELGFRTLDEAVGHSERLEVNDAVGNDKSRSLDFVRILARETCADLRFNPSRPKPPLENYDRTELLPEIRHLRDAKTPNIVLERTCTNTQRTVGTELSGEIASVYGEAGLPENAITVNFRGVGGQSFGAFLARGVTFNLCGEANDFLGKGLSGGIITVRPSEEAVRDGLKPEDNVIAGNVIAYGATGGRIFINGQAGERFAIRNSGVTLVAEGIGDHGCEYMTGGRVLVLGPTGVNFGAGMTGGEAWVYDETGDFDLNCNLASIDLATVDADSESERELLAILDEHIARTQSPKARRIRENWREERARFVRVVPANIV